MEGEKLEGQGVSGTPNYEKVGRLGRGGGGCPLDVLGKNVQFRGKWSPL